MQGRNHKKHKKAKAHFVVPLVVPCQFSTLTRFANNREAPFTPAGQLAEKE
jgi:hypothetical protein